MLVNRDTIHDNTVKFDAVSLENEQLRSLIATCRDTRHKSNTTFVRNFLHALVRILLLLALPYGHESTGGHPAGTILLRSDLTLFEIKHTISGDPQSSQSS